MAKKDEVFNENTTQTPVDTHDAKYDNDVDLNGWLRKDGTKKPDFDKGNAWRKGRGL